MELKEKLIRFREEQGLSQTELAKELGVTRQAVSGWERGANAPAREKLVALSRLYDVPLDELIGNTLEGCGHSAEPTLTAEETEPAPPEAWKAPWRMFLSRRAVAAALAGCILFAGLTFGIVLGLTLSKKPEEPKIIWTDDIEWENIDLTEVIDKTDGTTNIVP